MKPLTYNHGYSRGEERIVAIEYRRERLPSKEEIIVPFQVFTTDHQNPSAWICGHYDFDWCRRDECLYYHLSGSGGRFYIHPLARPAKPPLVPLWWDSSLVHPTNGGNSSNRKLSDATVTRFGYKIVPEPLPLFSVSANPFNDAHHASVEYCTRCGDHLQDDGLCEHIWWCEKCGVYSAPQDRCGHKEEAA